MDVKTVAPSMAETGKLCGPAVCRELIIPESYNPNHSVFYDHCYISEFAKAELQNSNCLTLSGAVIRGITVSVP